MTKANLIIISPVLVLLEKLLESSLIYATTRTTGNDNDFCALFPNQNIGMMLHAAHENNSIRAWSGTQFVAGARNLPIQKKKSIARRLLVNYINYALANLSLFKTYHW